MRSIKYILINDTLPQSNSGVSDNCCISNLGHHFIINSQGMLLRPIDIHQPGAFMPKPLAGQEDLNKCSIGIKYNGKLSDRQLRPLLISLLLDLRDQFPNAKILAKDEYDRWHIHVRDDINQLRRELSDYP